MAWAFVNNTSGDAAAAATTDAAAFANAAGNLLVLGAVVSFGGITIASITDTAGNTWQAAPNATTGAGDKRAHVWYAENIAAHAANVVTVTWSAATGGKREIQINQYNNDVGNAVGVADTGAVGGPSSAITTLATGSFTPVGAGNLNVAVLGTDSGVALTADGSYSLRGTKTESVQSEDLLSSASGAQTASFSWTGTTTAAIAAGSFKPPAAVGDGNLSALIGEPICGSSVIN